MDNNNNNIDPEIHELITEVEAQNNGTYREALIGNFINTGRENGLFESLLLVGTNMIIRDVSENNIVNNVIEESFQEKPKYKNIISEEGRKQLILTKYNSSIHINNSCPIFQTDFIENSDVIELPCKHVFVPEAINKWTSEENAICPICRYKLKSCEINITSSDISSDVSSDTNINSLRNTLRDISRDISLDISRNNLLNEPYVINNTNILNRFAYILEQQDRRLEEEELQQSILNSILDS